MAVERLRVRAVRNVPSALDLHTPRTRYPAGDDPAAGVVALVVAADDDQSRDPHLLQPIDHDPVGLGADALGRRRDAMSLCEAGDEVVPRVPLRRIAKPRPGGDQDEPRDAVGIQHRATKRQIAAEAVPDQHHRPRTRSVDRDLEPVQN